MSTGDGGAKYPQVVRAVTETPWAILPQTLGVILELVAYRAAGNRLSDEEIRERIGAGPARRETQSADSVAVLPLYGVLVPRATPIQKSSGLYSVADFAADFRAAVNDPQVGSILLDVNSPGGMTDLIPEVAAEIRAARGHKPIVAIANTDAASAAYRIAAQADELVVTPSGMVGSIGVFAAHEDISALQDKLGVKTTLVSAGKYKTETSPFQPLGEEARAAIQERVDEFYRMFVSDVAKGRRVAVDTVREEFGQGRVVQAKQALKAGMVDRIDTYEATLTRLVRGDRARPANTADNAAIDVTTISVSAGSDLVTVTSAGTATLAAAAISPHSTATVDEPWDGPAAVAAMPAEKATLRYCHAWVDDDGDQDAKSSYKFPHHKSKGGPANIPAVRNALARLPQSNIPASDRAGVERHLRRHLDDFNDKAAISGFSFADEAAAARDAALALVERARSLAELRVEGRLTAAKREQLAALETSLAGVAGTIAELLAQTDRPSHADAVLTELVRFERSRANL